MLERLSPDSGDASQVARTATAVDRRAASTSQMGRFETAVVGTWKSTLQELNSSAPAHENRQLIHALQEGPPDNRFILDMDS